MHSILVAPGIAIAAGATILISGRTRDRSVEQLIGSLARVSDSTQKMLDSLETSQFTDQEWARLCSTLTLSDLAICWWNSRIFLLIGNEVARMAESDPESADATVTAERIKAQHGELVRFLVYACREKIIGKVYRGTPGISQEGFAYCYHEARELLFYLVDNWRPENEGLILEAKL